MTHQIAVIDIGSNSVRLQISEVRENRNFKVVLEEKDTIRMGEEVFEKGYFGKESLQKALKTLKKFRTIIDSKKISHIRTVATAGFREAANQEDALNYLNQQTGLDIEVISGIDEARLIFLGVLSNFPLENRKALVVDIGGGSCELIAGNPSGVEDIKSLSLGCTRLTKFFLKSNPVKPYELDLLELHLDTLFSKIKKSIKSQEVDVIIATGGSLNNLTEIIYRLQNRGEEPLTREVTLKEVRELNKELAKRTYKERILLPALDKKRADIILAAGKVIEKIMLFYKKDSFTSLNKGLRDGLTLDTINHMGILLPFQTDLRLVKENRLWEIGHKYSFEEKHARNVTELALTLFDSLKKEFRLKEEWKEYLKAGALLHDIGYYISYHKHHKHSQYLIENSELIGFNEREVKLIGNIARYHRKSLPKISHVSFRELTILEKEIVTKMSAILRVADALDRSHKESIHSFQIDLSRPQEIRLIADAHEEDLVIEKEGIQLKADMFTQIFKRKIILEAAL